MDDLLQAPHRVEELHDQISQALALRPPFFLRGDRYRAHLTRVVRTLADCGLLRVFAGDLLRQLVDLEGQRDVLVPQLPKLIFKALYLEDLLFLKAIVGGLLVVAVLLELRHFNPEVAVRAQLRAF